MKPPFSLIAFLLTCSTLLVLMALGVFISTSKEEPLLVCGVKSPPEVYECGNAIEQLKLKESMDSLSYAKYQEGYRIFKEAGCASCHNMDTKKVGPALAGITKRQDTAWIKKAIINFDTLLAEKDPYAIALYNDYGKMQMPRHEFLSKIELEQLIEFLRRGR